LIKIINTSFSKIHLVVLIILYLFYNSCNSNDNISNSSHNKIDSTSYFINLSKIADFSIYDRLNSLNDAYRINSLIDNDSLKNRNLLKIAYEAKKLNDTSFFKKTNQEAFNLSQQLKDTFGIADTQWNFGSFYFSKEAWEKSYRSYYQAQVNFEAISNDLFSGKMLFNMANVQGRIKDYTGSEISTFRAISIFEPLEKSLELYRCYNHLGLVYKELREHEKAIEYHIEASRHLNKVKNKRTFVEGNLNNIGLVYQIYGNHYDAIVYFNKALSSDNLKFKNLSLYASLTDNLAYSEFLYGEKLNLENDFLRPLKIRDSINNVSGIIINKLHLAEYYAHLGDSAEAINYAADASLLAASVNNNRDWLVSLKLLSKLDNSNASTYLADYVKLNDSLQEQERIIRNKFTRIRFETDEYVEETKRLTLQKTLISIIGAISVMLISLLYLVKHQHSKTRELIFEKEQQSVNAEIYILMLKQQVKLEEGRLDERHRISEELHDGVLGKLFGTRVGLGFLSINGGESTMQKHKSYLSELKTIEEEIRDISHALKNEILSSRSDFIAMIEDYISRQCQLNNLEHDISISNTIHWDDIDDNIKVNLYRIIQEAVQNIIKHANSNKIEINFYLEKKMLNLYIKDDGIGFKSRKRRTGIGLKNIQSRISKLNGEFKINSRQNYGTHLTVLIPI